MTKYNNNKIKKDDGNKREQGNSQEKETKKK